MSTLAALVANRRNAVLLLLLGACGSPPLASPPVARPQATTPPPPAPAPAAPPPLVVHLAAGTRHACALRPGGIAHCWGDNVSGQLGDGSFETRTRAILSKSPPSIAIAAGDDFTCALDGQGHVTCWGGETPPHFGEDLSPAEQKGLLTEGCARGDKNSCRVIAFGKKVDEIVARQLSLHPERRAEFERQRAAGWGPEAPSARPPPGEPIPSLEDIEQISAAGTEVCARSKAGSVWCFAIAARSSMFFSSITDGQRHWKPTRVPGLEDAVQIATGTLGPRSFQSCAVRRSGQAVCWDGSDPPRPIPGVDDATQVAVGLRHACALRRSGEVACWGGGEHGQVGGSSTNADTVVAVAGLNDAVSLAAGGDSTCVRRAGGRVACWGELADLGGQGSSRLREVAGVDGAVEIAVGERFACASMPSGAVRCWGASSRGRLGRGVMPETLLPQQVEGITGAVNIQAFAGNSCALRGDGSVVCWGGGRRDPDKPLAALPGLSDVVSIGARDQLACAVQKDGKAACWGPERQPQVLDGVDDAVAVSPSVACFCAVRRTGEVACNYPGRALQNVVGVRGAVDVRVGASDWACVRKSTGAIACWQTEIGPPDSRRRTELIAVPAFRDAVDIATTGLDTCVVRKTGSLECFGSMHAPIVASPTPGVTDATAISMSESDVWSCILRRGGTVSCRDDENRWGETGDGPLGFRGPHYADVVGLTDVARVDVGYDHACAVKTTGTVWCWGNDDEGQVSGKGVGKFLDAADVVGLVE